ncbi:hypothetical protein [Methylomonas sp. AM2-LC]|uniref:hypothetical protein n=1 Tax=Methylomonas sp. AM2-LC TaxID=3153301 RepID=UPI003263B15A
MQGAECFRYSPSFCYPVIDAGIADRGRREYIHAGNTSANNPGSKVQDYQQFSGF